MLKFFNTSTSLNEDEEGNILMYGTPSHVIMIQELDVSLHYLAKRN